ncbi:MAG: tRNA lysidine(34) synthetase TilS [Thermodesulfovibrionales bacterium]|nr:tRNA lysidine(34) synthetase TilS [Thermodesulfovibrionales bacterium]MDP3111298.1 tRNA lysidine(34) synthetase TilS [Thermodesulfovibrionales bacterium]
MNLIGKVKATIKKHSMLREKDRVLAGLSGGPDSVCLLLLLNQLKDEYKLDLHAIYIDHGLRPEEIPAEIKFCKKLCENLNISFITKSVDVISYAKELGLNKQEAARELRYKAFDEIAFEKGANKIAIAHNADDQAETFFMRILRGSGQKGLSGIPPLRGKIIRPLIEIERNEIEEFLKSSSQSYVVDSSNIKKDYFRNWLRLSVMPEFQRKNPDLINTISRMSDIIREEDNYLELIVTKTLMKLIPKKTDKTIELFLVPLENMDRVILRRVLRRAIDAVKGLRGISFIHIEDIIGLIKNGDSGDRLYLPKGIRVIKGYSTLILTSDLPVKLGTYSLEVPGEVILREAGILIKSSIEEHRAEGKAQEKSVAIFDADKVKAPLTIRARKNGDFFYPAGFGKKKKLQDFFVDEKVPRDERDKVPIILSGEEIIWIAGYRGDERFNITSDTKKIVMLEIKPSR